MLTDWAGSGPWSADAPPLRAAATRPDEPAQMIALCPNCHALKTRGREREQLRQVLFEVARRRHNALTSQPLRRWSHSHLLAGRCGGTR